MILKRKHLYILIPVVVLFIAFLFTGCGSTTDKSDEYLNVAEEWYSIDKEAGTFKYLCVLENTSTDQIIHIQTFKLTGYNAEGDKIGKTTPAGSQSAFILPGQKAAICIDRAKVSDYWSDIPEEMYCSYTSIFADAAPSAVLSIANVSPNGSGLYGTSFMVNLKNDGEKPYNSADPSGGDYAQVYCEYIIVSRNTSGGISDVCIGFPEEEFIVNAGSQGSFPLFGEIHIANSYDIFLCQS